MVDLFRKLFIVGAVVLFGRGSVMQLFIAMVFSFFFFTAQMACWPMKLGTQWWLKHSPAVAMTVVLTHCNVLLAGQDNLLRASCECHIFFTIIVAMALKIPGDSHKPVLDNLLVSSFILLVPVAFVVVVARKAVMVSGTLNAPVDQDDEHDQGLVQSFGRFQIGLADATDYRILHMYADRLLSGAATNKHMTAGRRLWDSKLIVTHLGANQMKDMLYALEMKLRLTKSEELALHFTSKESARMILNGHGIRASTEGQLAGGVSVCVASLQSFGWDAFRPSSFRTTVAKALWGSTFSGKY